MMNEKYGGMFFPALSLSILAGLLMLSACATLDQNECINADWRSIGYEDGARGYKTSRIGDHRRACAQYGVTPDFDAYEKGRRQGLGEWCTPRNGYRLGSLGKPYNGVCPKELEPAHIEAFNQGKAVFAYAKEIQIQTQTLKNIHADLDAVERDLAHMEARLISNGVSPRLRKQSLEEIRILENERRLLLNDIADQEHAIGQMQDNLEWMKTQNPYQ